MEGLGNSEEKEPYFQVPKSLFRLRREGGISLTAFDIYVLMLDRYKVSKKHKWVDKEKNIYIIYSYEDLMEDLNVKSKNGISEALKELEELNFLQRKKRYRNSTMFYLKNESTENHTFIKSESIENRTLTKNESTENHTSMSTENHTFIFEKNTQKDIENKEEIKGEITPNKNNNSKNNINNNKNNNVIDPALKNEIHLLLRGRDIKANQITKICIDIQRIKDVIDWADKKELGNGFIIKALKENWKLGLDIQASSKKSGLDIQADKNNLLGLDIQANSKNPESQGKKDYSMSIDEALKRSRNKK
ncbi:replication initiator protein A [Fusobacterium sp.]|uniref:replication initiator protein A n=1 Tax=Fusobacterium sp. TaxID=68766 RepID=UPI003F9EC9F4